MLRYYLANLPGWCGLTPYVCEELKAKYNLDVQEQLTRLQLPYNFTNDYEPEHFIEMAEIKIAGEH